MSSSFKALPCYLKQLVVTLLICLSLNAVRPWGLVQSPVSLVSYIYLFVPSTDSGSFGFNEHTPYALGLSSDVTTPGSRPFSLLHGRIRFTEALYTKYVEHKLGNVFRALSEGNPFAYCRCSFTMPHPPAPAVGRVAFPLFKYRTAKQPRCAPFGSLSRGSSPTMDHAHFTIDTFLVQPRCCAAGLMCHVKATSSIQPHRARRNQITSVFFFWTPLRAGYLLLP